MRIAEHGLRIADALMSVVLAPSCAACDVLLDRPTRGPVCDACWGSILPLTPPLCDRCGDPLSTWRTDSWRPASAGPCDGPPQIEVPALCPRCRRAPRFVDRARAVGAYDGPLRAIVHALKYEGRRSLAKPLAAIMRDRAGDVLENAVCVVPVPLHPSRRRHRGFNQASDLARHLGPPVVRALARVRATATQADLPAAQRHRNVRNAFATTPACAALAGSAVVLVDDVCTTGATLDACAAALKAAGVREVRAVTAARVAASPR